MITEKQKAQARELLAEGKSVAAVARIVGCSYYNVQKIGDQKKHTEANPEISEDSSVSDLWEVTLRIPPGDVDGILLAAAEQEKATLVQFLLQGRIDAMLSPIPKEETPNET